MVANDSLCYPRALQMEWFQVESIVPSGPDAKNVVKSGTNSHQSELCDGHCSDYNPRGLLDGAVENISRQWQILALGQLLSFLNVANGAAQASLSLSCHLVAPFFTLGLVYFCLSLGLIPIWWQGRKDAARQNDFSDESLKYAPPASHASFRAFDSISIQGTDKPILEPAFQPDPNRNYSLLSVIPLSAPPLAYLPMATLDCYAQFFFLTSLRHTTLTSVTLLDSIAIPTAMLLSSLVLARKYRFAHYVGIFSCFVGIFMDVFQDYTAEDETGTGGADLQEYPHKIRGDMLAIMGAICFGCQEVLGEVAVRNLGGSNEYLAMLGFWACIIALGHSYLVEKQQLLQFIQASDQLHCAKDEAWILLTMYVIANSCYYHGVARFLQLSDAAFLNLSLLTGCVWSVLYGVLFLSRAPKTLFYFAVFFIIVGVITYEMASSPIVEDEAGHALENARFRRWRTQAMRLKWFMVRRQASMKSSDGLGDELVGGHDERKAQESGVKDDDHVFV